MRGVFFVLVWRCGATCLFCFFRDEEWALTINIFFFVVFFFRRPSYASIDAHSLLLSLSFFLSFLSPSLSLSLSTDNNNFTKDKVLAKQQKSKTKPQKEKTRPRLLRKIYPQDFFVQIDFLPSNGVESNPAAKPQKKREMLTRMDPCIYLAPNCATTSFRKTPPHKQTNKQVNLLLRFANPKASKKKSTYEYFFSFFLPAHSPQSKSLLK
jgi:hypothetical protein